MLFQKRKRHLFADQYSRIERNNVVRDIPYFEQYIRIMAGCFEDEMSNKLPVGVKIFTTKEKDEMFLVVESDGEILKYYAIIEG